MPAYAVVSGVADGPHRRPQCSQITSSKWTRRVRPPRRKSGTGIQDVARTRTTPRAAKLSDHFRPCYIGVAAAGKKADGIATRLVIEAVEPLVKGAGRLTLALDVTRHSWRPSGSAAKRNQHLAALRGFFDRLVQRHVVILNPAASVKGVKEQVIEGKTPEITLEQARTLLGSIKVAKTAKNDQGEEIEIPLTVGLRDRAILATLAYTVCRAGAVAKLRLQDFQHDGTQYVLRFSEKGGKSREIPVRLELQRDILAYLKASGIDGEADDRPLFRSAVGRTKKLTENALTTERICELVKRRLKDAGLPKRISPHSFRVAAITDLLTKGEKLEDVQYLAGHTEPRTTGLYDRRKTKATLSIQLKLNELLASAHRASPQMINIEDKSEEEVRELHDRYQKIQQKGPGAHSMR